MDISMRFYKKLQIMYIRLNPQYKVRNEKYCSYIIKLQQKLDTEIPDLSDLMMLVPPFIGYILAHIGSENIVESIQNISSVLNVSSQSLIHFIQGILHSKPKKMNFFNKEVLFPQNLLINSKTQDTRIYHTDEDFLPTDRFIKKRPSIPLNLNFMVTTKCMTNCIYCYANKNLRDELTCAKIKEVLNECNKVGVINVSLTGGDIFARNDWKELILSCVTLGYYPFLSTKTPLSFNDVRFLKNQHINEIQFSLDSLSDSILSSMINCSLSYLQKVKEMFVYCEKVGIKLIIRSVITTYNQSVDNFKKIFSFLVKFTNIQFWAITPAFLSEFKKYKNFYPSNSNLSNIVKFVDNIDSPFPIYLNKLNSEGYKLKIFDNVEDFVNHNQICHADVYMMSILSNGICTPCEMLYENPDFIMGNIKKNSLVEIWNSNKALNLFMPKQSSLRNTNSPCATCATFDQCRKSMDRRICFVDVSKTSGSGCSAYPDPRCPKSANFNVIL